MTWSGLATAFRTESLVGFIAVVITATNAPIFQNVGGDSYDFERVLVAGFYIALMISALCLFVGRLAFEFFCPALIKQFRSSQAYMRELDPAVDDETLEAWENARILLYSQWRDQDEASVNRLFVIVPLCLFAITLVLAFALGIASLVQFAMR